MPAILISVNIQVNNRLSNQARVFDDRKHAGKVLAEMLNSFSNTDALLLAIPSGGIPVAVEIAEVLGLELDVIPVSKILFPWTTESGFGAVAFDGTTWLNDAAIKYYGLDEKSVEEATRQAADKIQRRLELFHGKRLFSRTASRTVILVDDGIASGYTIRTGVEALHKAGMKNIVVAVPTASANSLNEIAKLADVVYCANVREGHHFAVADAYRNWTDVDENEAASIFSRFRNKSSAAKSTWADTIIP